MAGSVEQVRIAARSGFCYGVREALDAALIAGSAGPTATLGAIVHNEGANERLRAAGVGRIESLADAPDGSTVVIRAHGVTPTVRAEAASRELSVIDGTCSWVTAEHREMERLVASGATIVLLGTPGHPETTGLLGYAPEAIVVDEEDEWEARIPRRKRMALISQSTQPPWKFERLAAFLAARAHELTVINTVCPVTVRRQADTVELARSVDVMIVVGGKTSANTRELVRLCSEIEGKPTLFIGSAAEMTGTDWLFEGARTVGITGGTSTPIEDLTAVAHRLIEIAGSEGARSRREAIVAEALAGGTAKAHRTTSLSG
jgi:(E)-4-hydroxy-3-methyl-but-2-enyl pyrophosphate reductase